VLPRILTERFQTVPKLSPRDIAALTLPPGKSDALYFDHAIPGLALRLRAGGRKSWVFQYRIGNKQRRLSLGSATALNAHEARKRAALLHAEVKLGGDPAGDKSAARVRANETFASVLPLFLARQNERLRPRAFIEIERHLKVHATRLHHLPLADIARRDVAGVLTSTATRLSNASANRVRTSLSSFFSWSIREGLLDANPAAWTERREEVARNRLLTDDEIREIWAALRDDAYGDIMRLLILSGARREEIGALRWSEVNVEHGLISLAPERTKNHRAHEILLSPPALAVLKSRSRLAWPDGSPCDLVFGRGARGFADWVGSKTDLDGRILAARQAAAKQAGADVAEVKPMPAWTPHDFRRLISTTMHDRLGVAPHIVEAILGHVGHQAGTAGRYNLALYRAEKVRALTLWGAHVETIVTGRERRVVAFERR
jgi:integrase